MSDHLCHCRPEPIEAPQPNAPRRTDLVWQRAMAFGWRAMLTEEPAVVSIPSFEVGCRAAMEYLAVHDRRGK